LKKSVFRPKKRNQPDWFGLFGILEAEKT